MINRKCLSLLLAAALFIISACGVPNYFDYTADISFTAKGILQTDGTAQLYLDPNIIDRVRDGEISPIPTTPKLYLLYSVSGLADRSSTNLISSFNSSYRNSISNYPSSYEDFIKTNTAPSDGAQTVQYALYPFTYYPQGSDRESQLNITAAISDFAADGSYDIKITQKSLGSGEFVLTLERNGQDPVDLYRFNGKTFRTGITNYETESDDEFSQYSSDASATTIVSPQIKVYLASSLGFRSYTNFLFAKMPDPIAVFNI